MSTRTASHFFGRRKGKTLRQRHSSLIDSLLPRLRVTPDDLRRTGPQTRSDSQHDLWLEVGFGGGEHLVSDAQAHPDVSFIGCEPFVNGVAKLLAAIDDTGLDNIRVYDGDALQVLAALPDESLGRITILYPDPWPKSRQRKRRFISPESVEQMARTLRPGAEVHFATDIDDYSAWTLARFLACRHFEWRGSDASDWKRPWIGWPGTRYEAKAVREGRTPAYLTFVRAHNETQT